MCSRSHKAPDHVILSIFFNSSIWSQSIYLSWISLCSSHVYETSCHSHAWQQAKLSCFTVNSNKTFLKWIVTCISHSDDVSNFLINNFDFILTKLGHFFYHLSIYLSIYLTIDPCIFICTYLPLFLSSSVSFFLSYCVSVCVPLYLSTCVSM